MNLRFETIEESTSESQFQQQQQQQQFQVKKRLDSEANSVKKIYINLNFMKQNLKKINFVYRY